MLLIIACIVGTVLCAIVGYFISMKIRMKNYWEDRGFERIEISRKKRSWNIIKTIQIPINERDKELHDAMKQKNQPFAGYMELSTPVLMIRDVELLKHIFVKDFDHFVNHRDYQIGKIDERAGKMLIFMEGEPWKELRSKMSPTFTTGKIRRMFDIIENCSQRLATHFENEAKESHTADLIKGFEKYTVDVIANAAFGLESGAFREKKSIFEKMSDKLRFKLTFKAIFRILVTMTVPRIAKYCGIQFFDNEACAFYSSTIVSTIKHREMTGENREDFLQLMLEASAGQLKADESELSTFEKEAVVNDVKAKPKVTLTKDVICAQSILFFFAGFDTVQTLLLYASYHLAISPEIQDKLAEEVKQTFKKHGGRFTYESINEMEYMEKVLAETLRMYPPNPRLDRTCTKEYNIPGTELVIPLGTQILIPSYAIHHDEDIYPEPYRFDPERFSKEAKACRSAYAYLSFGHGPRGCIGMRFALTECKLGIAHLIQKFILEPSEKTPIPLKFPPTAVFKPGDEMLLKLRPRRI